MKNYNIIKCYHKLKIRNDRIALQTGHPAAVQRERRYETVVLKKEVYGVWILYNLEGRLDAESAPELDKAVDADVPQRMDMAINLEKLSYISSMGIRSLVSAAKKANEVNHRIVLCNVNGAVNEVIEAAGIKGLIDVYDDISELPFANDFLSVHRHIENSNA